MMQDISERFDRLKSIRESLCKKNEKWNEVFELRDWLINHLKDLTEQAKSDKISKEDVINRLEDLLCVVETEEEDNE